MFVYSTVPEDDLHLSTELELASMQFSTKSSLFYCFTKYVCVSISRFISGIHPSFIFGCLISVILKEVIFKGVASQLMPITKEHYNEFSSDSLVLIKIAISGPVVWEDLCMLILPNASHWNER